MSLDLNVFDLPVFADANIWSMWPADKLNELAEDIKDNGFDHRYPITIAEVEGVMMLLDGRNRREAAKIAGIVPPVIVTDVEPSLAVLRSNYSTRTASDGQKAMAYAMQFPEAKRGAHSHLKNLSGTLQVYLSNARYVRRNNPIPDGKEHPQICYDVVNGLITLSDSFKQTQIDVKRREEEEAIRQANAEKLNDVRARYPNLAALVDDEQLSLAQAIASAEQSDRDAKEEAERIERNERERIIRENDLSAKANKIRQYDDELADRVASGELTFEKAMSIIEERETTERKSRIGLMTAMNGLVTNAHLITELDSQKKLLKLKGYWVDFQSSTQYSVDHVIKVSRKMKENIDNFIAVIEELR